MPSPPVSRPSRLAIPFLLLGFLPLPAGAAPAAACLPAPVRVTAVDLERDLARIERLSRSIVAQAKADFCGSLKAFDFDAWQRQLQVDGRFERLFPQRETVLVESAGGRGTVVEPARHGCFGDAAGWRADFERLSESWIRIDRCSFKPYRILADRDPSRPIQIAFDLELGAVSGDGSRLVEHWQGEAELRGDAASGWTFETLRLGERHRFEAPRTAFVDRTREAGLPTDWDDAGYDTTDIAHGQILYGGVAVGDADGDGWPDLYLSRAGENALLLNRQDGTFGDVTAAAGVAEPGNSQAAIWADLDGDGDQDLFVVNAWYSLVGGEHTRRGHVLYRNDSTGGGLRFTALPQTLGPIGPASGAAAADYDGDGRLDLYVTYYQDKNLNPYHHYIEARDGLPNRLYRNLGGLRFADVTAAAGVGGSGWSYGAAWADYDGDGWIDLYVANDYGDNALYRNLGGGRFVETTAFSGTVDAANGMGVDWGDYDNDGRLDLYIANMYSKTGRQYLNLYQGLDPEVMRKLRFSAEGNSLYRNGGDGTFGEQARQLGASTAGWAWGSNFFDYDNDGWLDLHVANGFWAGGVEADA